MTCLAENLDTWNFIKKRLQHRYFPEKFFRRTLFTEHLRMSAPADYLVSTKVLFSDYTSFFPSFYPFITDNRNYGSLFREGIKMKIFFIYTNLIDFLNSLWKGLTLKLPTPLLPKWKSKAMNSDIIVIRKNNTEIP